MSLAMSDVCDELIRLYEEVRVLKERKANIEREKEAIRVEKVKVEKEAIKVKKEAITVENEAIRAIKVENGSSDADVVVHVTFKQAGQKEFTIGKGATVSVEESIDKGDWTECDPI